MVAHFYPIDRVDVPHAIQYYASHFLERFVWSHDAHGASLHHHVTLR